MAAHTLNMLRSRALQIGFIFAFLSLEATHATEWTGGLDLGFWHVRNNLLDNSRILENDGVDKVIIDKTFSSVILNLRAEGQNVFDATNFHIDARSVLNPLGNRYTVGADQNRYDIRQFALEFEHDTYDLWVGRQRILEAGNVGVDGLRTVFHLSSQTDLAFYGGIGNNPRNYTGNIGPYYEANPFTTKLQGAGTYLSTRAQKFQIDLALNALLFELKPDRIFVYSQTSYQLNSKWSVSGVAQYNLNGPSKLETLQASVITKPSKKFTNTLSAYRFVSLWYDRSGASVIPSGTVSDLTLIRGNEQNITSYYTVREHFMWNILSSNYIFGAVEYSKRSFDDLTRYKYTTGFRDPALFNSTWDLRVQTDLIQNFRGFSSIFDFMIGKDFADGVFHLDAGLSLYSNERDVFVGNVNSGNPRQTDEEYALRLIGTWMQSAKLAWNGSYTYNHEVDATNGNQDVNTHEFFVMSNIRF